MTEHKEEREKELQKKLLSLRADGVCMWGAGDSPVLGGLAINLSLILKVFQVIDNECDYVCGRGSNT